MIYNCYDWLFEELKDILKIVNILTLYINKVSEHLNKRSDTSISLIEGE